MAAKDDFLSSLRAERLRPLLPLREAMRIVRCVSDSSSSFVATHDALPTASPLIVSTTFKGEGDSSVAFNKQTILHSQEKKTQTVRDKSSKNLQKDLGDGFKRFYGEATSSSSHGGHGGSDNNFDKFKYYFEIPSSYEKDVVNKTEKIRTEPTRGG